MLIIDNTTTVKVQLQNAITTNEMDVTSFYRETDATTFNPKFNIATTSGTTPVDLVPTASSGKKHTCDTVSIFNKDTVGNTVIVTITSGTPRILVKATLLPDEALQYDGNGWYALATDGSRKSVSISRSPLSSGETGVVLTSDVINNNAVANTLQDVTGLFFPLLANQKYWFKFHLVYTAAATTTGSRWSINGPTFAFLGYEHTYALTINTKTISYQVAYDQPAASNASSYTATGLNIATIEGQIHTTGAGDLIVRHASEVASSAITAKAGSFGRLLLL